MNHTGARVGVSIILCTYNGLNRLEPTLSHLCALKPVDLMELVVVDNCSNDGTGSFCSAYLQRHCGYEWKVVAEEQPGLIYARRKGISSSKYPLLLFCDDDNYLSSSYVQLGASVLQEHPNIGALGGRGIAVFESAVPEWFERYHYSFATGAQHTSSGKINKAAAEIYGAASFWRRTALEAIYSKGIEPILSGRSGGRLVSGDDVEWCYLVQLAGFEIWYEEELEFGHLMPKGRLNWAYYLKLKQGIAAGSAPLFAYQVLLQNRNCSSLQFLLLYFRKTLTILFQLLRFRLSQLFAAVPAAPERQVAAVTFKSRLFSFFKNSTVAYQRFCFLKRVF